MADQPIPPEVFDALEQHVGFIRSGPYELINLGYAICIQRPARITDRIADEDRGRLRIVQFDLFGKAKTNRLRFVVQYLKADPGLLERYMTQNRCTHLYPNLEKPRG